MKVLIGVSANKSQQFCLDEFVDALKSQKAEFNVLFVVNHDESAYASLIKSKGFSAVVNPVSVVDVKECVSSKKNFLRSYALENGFDFVLFLDQDMILPDGFSVQKLLDVRKDLVSGVYLSVFEIDGSKVSVPFLLKDVEGGGQLFIYEAMFPPKVFEVGACGGGCLLVSRKVLEKVVFDGSFSNEGVGFCVNAKKDGFGVWANSSVKCVLRVFPKKDPRAKVFEWRTNIEDTTYDVKWPD